MECDMTVCLDKSFVHVSVRYRAAEWSVEARRRCFAATALASYDVPGTKYQFLMEAAGPVLLPVSHVV